MTPPTYQQWLVYFPPNTFQDFTEQNYDLFEPKVSLYVPVMTSYPFPNYYTLLFIYCMAHFAWEWEATVKGDHTSDAGPIMMAKIDKISVSYQGGTVTNEFESFFGQSRFGREFINLIYSLRKDDPSQLFTIGVV